MFLFSWIEWLHPFFFEVKRPKKGKLRARLPQRKKLRVRARVRKMSKLSHPSHLAQLVLVVGMKSEQVMRPIGTKIDFSASKTHLR